jgi:hypothetical protein
LIQKREIKKKETTKFFLPLSLSVFILPNFTFILTQKVIDPRVKESTLALTHTQKERETHREREHLSYIIFAGELTSFSPPSVYFWENAFACKLPLRDKEERRDERASFPGAQPTRGQRLPVSDVLSV